MTSRTSIRSRLTSQRENRDRLAWSALSANQDEGVARVQNSFRQSQTSLEDVQQKVTPVDSASFYLGSETAEDRNYAWNHRVGMSSPQMETLNDWRKSFTSRANQPSNNETEHQTKPSFNPHAGSFHLFQTERDSTLSEDHDRNGSIFESRRFQSLRSKKQRDLEILSQRYKQNQEDWKRYLDDGDINANNNLTNGVKCNQRTDGTSYDQGLENKNETEQLRESAADQDSEVFKFSYQPESPSQEHEFPNEGVDVSIPPVHLDSSSQLLETHFDSDQRHYSSKTNKTYSSQSSADRQSWTGSPEDHREEVNTKRSNICNRINSHENNFEYDDGSYYEEDGESFTRSSSKRTSRQQTGFKETFQGLLARIGRKIGKTDTPKLNKDEKIIAIMLQRKQQEETEAREREEAHARWEAERQDLQRNALGRRSIDPNVFRRRNSLGDSVGGSKRETSKPRALNIEKQAERKKQNELQQEEQRYQLQIKLENDFQRANSLRASISQQNLLKAKLKNLHLEQKQQHISQQKRKSMENLSQLKKQLETKHIIVEQKLENMKKEQRKSREDLRCKQQQSRLRLQQLNEELAHYQAELQEFNDKQLQHADYLVKRAHFERKEAARRERLEKERALLENRKRIQEEEQRRAMEKEELIMAKEKKREQLVREKMELHAKSKAAARASQLLREEIRNCDDLTLTAKKLAALQERSFMSKRSSDTDSLNSAITSPAYPTQRTKM